MTERLFTKLENKRILVIEHSEDYLKNLVHYLHATQLLEAKTLTKVPENLLEVMQRTNIELAIVHITKISEVEPVIKAHQAGVKIVVLERNPELVLTDNINVYPKLREAGVPLVRKIVIDSKYVSITTALKVLSDLI